MTKKTLRTFEEVLSELGGVHGVMAITRRSQQAVCNWRRVGMFPTVLVDRVNNALEKNGCVAASRLFNIEPVRQKIDAA